MTRFTSAAFDTAASAAHVPYVLLAEFDFVSGFVRVNSADRSFTHQGNTFTGLGHLAGIGPVKENGELVPEKVGFSLSGVDSSLLTTTLTEKYHGRAVRLWLAYLTEALALVDTPELLWEGSMDTMAIHTEVNASLIDLVCENRLIRWNDRAGWLYTKEHQQVFDATDSFLNFVATLVNKVVTWAGVRVGTGNARGWPGDYYGELPPTP